MTINRVITQVGEKTSHYQGEGYEYWYSTDKIHGRQCKLHVPKQVLFEFEIAVGKCNSTGLTHLQVLDQSCGWWLITSDQPERDGVVSQFIARFNRWMLTNASKKKAAAAVLPDADGSTTTTNYTIKVREEFLSQRRREIKVEPQYASTNALEELAQAVNSRYGHKNRR
jgi:hypothetical protein